MFLTGFSRNSTAPRRSAQLKPKNGSSSRSLAWKSFLQPEQPVLRVSLEGSSLWLDRPSNVEDPRELALGGSSKKVRLGIYLAVDPNL